MAKIGRTERISHKKTIAMAVHERDWNRIEKAHDKDAESYSDFDTFSKQYAAPDKYLEVLEHPTTYKSTPGIGMSKKMIHDISDEESSSTFMAKPYYPRLSSQTRSWVKHPIAGWSTMTSKALFDAAGMGDDTEKVYVHKHKDVPLTVHEFSPGYKTVFDFEDQGLPGAPIMATPNPLDIKKIAVMDFLMGNNDRHGHNLMVSSHQDPTGHNKLLAIDHERNFQYDKALNQVLNWKFGGGVRYGQPADSPADFINLSALKLAEKASYKIDSDDLKEWWDQHSKAIKESFYQQLNGIKNPRLKEHIKKNFEQRAAIIDKWASTDDEYGYQNIDLFSKEFPYKANIQNMPRPAKEKVENLLNRLPENPLKAIETLVETAKHKKGLAAQDLIRALFRDISSKLSDEQLIKLFDSVRKDHSKKLGRNLLASEILLSVYKRGDKRQAAALIEWDNGKGTMSQYWIDRLKDVIYGE